MLETLKISGFSGNEKSVQSVGAGEVSSLVLINSKLLFFSRSAKETADKIVKVITAIRNDLIFIKNSDIGLFTIVRLMN